MALPKLNVPQYELELPSNGKKITYRPFLVKEQKVLMMAQEGNDEQETIRAVRKVITDCCITNGINVDELPLFDIEYFFLQLRSKSIGEKISLYFRHQICPNNDNLPAKNQTEIVVDLNKVKVIKDKKHEPKIKLTDDVGIIMKHPKIDMINKFQNLDRTNITAVFEIIGNCVDQIYDANETYSPTDYTPKELEAFLSEMTETQFEKIQDFFLTMPKIKYSAKFKCIDCQYEDVVEVEGLQNFFT